MSYPTMPDIIAAVKVPQLIKDPELAGAIVIIAKSGMPVMFNGGFSMVFPMVRGNEKWGFKVWHTLIKDVKDRYKEVSKYLVGKNIDCFANFTYVENGILVNGQLLDTSRMKWVEGSLLKDYIKENINKPANLRSFAYGFMQLTERLHGLSISHGDLQHGNIIIQKDDSITLIDYDSICVPAIDGEKEFVTGLVGYQHPSRFSSSKCSVKADYFSELVIYLSVLAIAELPALWNKYKIETTEVLLFSRDDFEHFSKSAIKADLDALSPSIQFLASLLESYLKEKDFTQLHPFQAYLKSPVIVKFSIENNVTDVIAGEEVLFEWETENTKEVSISNAGILSATGAVKISFQKSTDVTLKAINFLGHYVSQTISIKVHQMPQIALFKADNEKLKSGQAATISWNVKDAEAIWLNGDDITSKSIRGKGVIIVTPGKDSQYILKAHSFGSLAVVTATINISVFSPVRVALFSSSSPFTIQGKPIKLRWDVSNATKLIIEPGVGDVTACDEIEVAPGASTTYRLAATNGLFGDSSKTVRIEVLPLPKITAFNLPMPPQLNNIKLPQTPLLHPVITAPVQQQSKLPLFKGSIAGAFTLITSFMQEKLAGKIKKQYKKTHTL